MRRIIRGGGESRAEAETAPGDANILVTEAVQILGMAHAELNLGVG